MSSATALVRPVCVNCKLRKKKCDRTEPSCGYCIAKKLECQYMFSEPNSQPFQLQQKPLPAFQNALVRSSIFLSNILSNILLPEPINVHSTLYFQVLQIVQATGRSVEDVITSYFCGVHYFIPIISRSVFQDQVTNQAASPSGPLSVLLLSICLITYHPVLSPHAPQSLDRETLYLATKTIFAQAQAFLPPSLPLVQAGIIIAVYEYAHYKITDAISSICVCARMGQATRIHLAEPAQQGKSSSYQQAEDEYNTWWQIIILERTIFCELDDFKLPLVTQMHDISVPLPKEGHEINPESQRNSESFMGSRMESTVTEYGGFAGTAQAAWFLDQVFKALHIDDLDTRLLQLDGLDHALRTFLNTIMDSDGRILRRYCTPIVLAIRTLYILHLHIISQVPKINESHKRTPSELRSKSSAVLNTLITMTEDVTIVHSDFSLPLMDSLPPSFAFIILTTIKNMEYSEFQNDRLNAAKKKLDLSLQKFRQRWGA